MLAAVPALLYPLFEEFPFRHADSGIAAARNLGHSVRYQRQHYAKVLYQITFFLFSVLGGIHKYLLLV